MFCFPTSVSSSVFYLSFTKSAKVCFISHLKIKLVLDCEYTLKWIVLFSAALRSVARMCIKYQI